MRQLRSLERRSCGCCLFTVLVFLLLIGGLIFLAARKASAAAPAEMGTPAYDVVLVSDQSPSMWDCDGIGTDPQMLRVDATRLFINYLGADSSSRYRLALLHFGGQVTQIAPPTELGDAAGRQKLIDAASHPQPIPYTDHLLALRAATNILHDAGLPESRRLVVMLTDGEPAPNPAASSTAYDDARYAQALRDQATTLANAGASLAVVLLSDLRTSCGRHAAQDWTARWAEIAESTPGGALYTAGQSDDLLPIYHAIVRGLMGAGGAAEQPKQAVLSQQPFIVDVPVTGSLASLVLTVWKDDRNVSVQVRDPAGKAVAGGQANVTVTGQDAVSREEIWRIDRPGAGNWQVVLSGQGRVMVWQDRLPLLTPRSPAPTITASAAATAAPTDTPTLTPRPSPSPEDTPVPSPALTPVPAEPPAAIPAPPSPPASTPVTPPGTWLYVAGGGALLLALAGWGVTRSRGPFLTGQLVPVAVPAGSDLAIPLDLGRDRRKGVLVGKHGTGRWRLPDWPATVRLSASDRRTVTIGNVEGEVSVNGQPLRHPKTLEDGAVIACGEYRLRYENLLA
jgi:Mg-chelatase subunit ChlD